MTWGGENDFEQYEGKPLNGCRGLFFATIITLTVAAIITAVVLIIKC